MTTINLDSVEFYQPPSRAEPAGKNPVATLQHKGETAGDTRDGDAGTLKSARSNHSESGRGDNGSWDSTIPLSLRAPTASPSPAQPPVLGQSTLQDRAAHSAVDQAPSPFMWSPAPSTSAAGSEARCPILRQMTDDSISDPLPPDTLLSPIHDIQTCESSHGAHKDIEPHHSASEGKREGDKRDGQRGDEWEDEEAGHADGSMSATGATGTRNSSKRTADGARLNEGGESAHRSDKVRRADLTVSDEADDTDDDLNDSAECHRFLSLVKPPPRPVIINPLERLYQQRECTTSSSRSSEVGDNQDNPLVIEDDRETTSQTSISTRATSMESEIGTVHLPSSHLREQPKTHGSLSPDATTEPIIEPTNSPFNRPISPSVALSCDPVEQATSGGDRGAAATVDPPHAITVTPPLPEQPEDHGASALDEEEWEIIKILDKRETLSGTEYMIRWKNTWLPKRELGNAQKLLREYEAKGRAQRGCKRGRPAGAGKDR